MSSPSETTNKLQDAVDRLQRGMLEHQPTTVAIFRGPHNGWTVELSDPDEREFEAGDDLGTALADVMDRLGWR